MSDETTGPTTNAVPELLEALLTVHAAPSAAWVADAASTAAERGLGALYSVLYLADAGGRLEVEQPASTDRMRRLARLFQALDGDLASLRVRVEDTPALRAVLAGGHPTVVRDLSELFTSLDASRVRATQEELGVAKAWLAPLERSGGDTLGVVLLLMPALASAPLVLAELFGRHVAIALGNLREREAGRKHGELDAVRWVYDEQRFMEELQQEARRAQRHGRPLSVLYLRVRNLDELRRRFGSFLSDRVLRHVAGRLADAMRDTDFLGAAGSDGFAAILVEADLEGAARAEQRLLAGLGDMKLPNADLPGLHVDLVYATATLPEDGVTAEELADVARSRLEGDASIEAASAG
jgi:diguanylate cyclase (GGDEF)-like protein